jgi:hypothetical protein
VKQYKGSFSVLGTTGQVTAAKVVIFESGRSTAPILGSTMKLFDEWLTGNEQT